MADMEDFYLGMESCCADTTFVRTDWHGYFHDADEPRLLQVNTPNATLQGSPEAQRKEML